MKSQRAEVMQWRKAERKGLIAERLAMDSNLRECYGRRIEATLEEAIDIRSACL